jgi:hypothetical protein
MIMICKIHGNGQIGFIPHYAIGTELMKSLAASTFVVMSSNQLKAPWFKSISSIWVSFLWWGKMR